MNNFTQSFKNFASRLTVFSWSLIVIVIGSIAFAGVGNILNTRVALAPDIDESTGLIENVAELPAVSESEDKTGEILPPNTAPPTPQADTNNFATVNQ